MAKLKARPGRKNYRTEEFVPYILHAETGIHEAVTMLPAITDGDVANALNRLIQRLQAGSALPQIEFGTLDERNVLLLDADRVKPVDLIMARIVDHWHQAFDRYGERTNADLAGVLGTVLDSLQTWTRGPKSRGYLVFLAEFLKQAGVKVQVVPAGELGLPLPPSEAAHLPVPPPDLGHQSQPLPPASSLPQPLRPAPAASAASDLQQSPVTRRTKALDARTFQQREELSQAGFRAVERGDYKAAERDFRRALAIADGDATLFGLGVVCAMTERFEEAYHLFVRAVELVDDDSDYWYNLGSAAQSTLRVGRALRAFERCLALGIDDKALRREAEARIKLLRKSIDAMQRDWGSHLSVEELIRQEDVYTRAADALEREEYELAADLFRESIALNARHYQSWGNLGTSLLSLGKLDEAERALRGALEIKPSYNPARMNLEVLARVRAGHPLPPITMINKGLPHGKVRLTVREPKK